jgi:hypothetical protein
MNFVHKIKKEKGANQEGRMNSDLMPCPESIQKVKVNESWVVHDRDLEAQAPL